MDSRRLVIAQFCDDIRHEVGHKYSLIGCYGDEMIVDKLPAMLPKLCVQIRVLTPVDRPFARLLIRARINDENLAEMEMPVPDIEAFRRKAAVAELGRLSTVALMVLSPLAVAEPCKLQIEAETEDGTIRGSSLTIRERAPEDNSPRLA